MKDFSRRYDSIKITGLTDNSLYNILEWFPSLKKKMKRRKKTFSHRAESLNTPENSSALSSPAQRSFVAFGVLDKGVVLLLCYYEDQSLTRTGRSPMTPFFSHFSVRLRGALCFSLKKINLLLSFYIGQSHKCSSSSVDRLSTKSGQDKIDRDKILSLMFLLTFSQWLSYWSAVLLFVNATCESLS